MVTASSDAASAGRSPMTAICATDVPSAASLAVGNSSGNVTSIVAEQSLSWNRTSSAP